MVAAYTAKPGKPNVRRDGRVEYYRGAVPQHIQHRLHRQHDAFDIDGQLAIDLFLGQFFERGGMAAAGVGEQDVELAVCSLDGVRYTLHVGLDARVSLNAMGTLAKLGDGRLEHLLPTARDVDRRAMLDQSLCRTEADAGRAAGDERNAPFKCLCGHLRQLNG